MTPKQPKHPNWGGKREGAGRKRAGPLRHVSHKKRPQHMPRFPVHAVLRIREDVPRRTREVFAAVRAALESGAERDGFRLVHYSVQGNHLHLIVEAEDARALSRGMQGIAVRVARAINRASARRGKVFADHYFTRELRTPAEVRRAVRYVLDNVLLHGKLAPQTDRCASRTPVAAPTTWLLRIGWQRSRAGPLPVAYWDV